MNSARGEAKNKAHTHTRAAVLSIESNMVVTYLLRVCERVKLSLFDSNNDFYTFLFIYRERGVERRSVQLVGFCFRVFSCSLFRGDALLSFNDIFGVGDEIMYFIFMSHVHGWMGERNLV